MNMNFLPFWVPAVIAALITWGAWAKIEPPFERGFYRLLGYVAGMVLTYLSCLGFMLILTGWLIIDGRR